MAIESVTCPSCGATGIQIDTTREHSFCSYCGTTVKTKDVLHLDVESVTLEKLKRNAQKSFDVGQYGNARADWRKVIQLDRTDHESYFGIVRCDMATRPDMIFGQDAYAEALAYAPAEIRVQYIRYAEAHNIRARAVQAEIRNSKARAIQEEIARLSSKHKWQLTLAILLTIFTGLFSIPAWKKYSETGKEISKSWEALNAL